MSGLYRFIAYVYNFISNKNRIIPVNSPISIEMRQHDVTSNHVTEPRYREISHGMPSFGRGDWSATSEMFLSRSIHFSPSSLSNHRSANLNCHGSTSPVSWSGWNNCNRCGVIRRKSRESGVFSDL